MDIPFNGDRPGDNAGAAPTQPTAAPAVLVWDLPVRLFHWLMVAAFALAWLTSDSERWRELHVALGYTMAGLVGFRLVWGLIGTRHARFAAFVRGPRAVLAYLRSLKSGHPEHHAGHNPAGALAIVALLALTLAVAGSGWLTYQELGGEWLEEAHELAAHAMLVVVGVHLAGVLLGSLAHRENLVGSMITGRKRAAAAEAIARPRRGVALLLAAGVLALWAWLWNGAYDAGAASGAVAATAGTDADRGGTADLQPAAQESGRRRRHDDD